MIPVVSISKYDGQVISLGDSIGKYELHNYLGSGSSGVIYEGIDLETGAQFAIKILHPIGIKLTRSSSLARYVLVKGSKEADEVCWMVHPSSPKQVVACYFDEKHGCFREMTLSKCIEYWGTHLEMLDKMNGVQTERKKINATTYVTIPYVPGKYLEYLRQRQKIFKEIENMDKIQGHENVLQLYQVLELIQDSKCTLFLVLELCQGGELFDRIRVDQGCDEKTALCFFRQLLSGVAYCHERGVCHRDLKPENLLLNDDDILKIADFGLSALTVDSSTSSNQMKRLMSVVGSPHYVAPEILQETGYDGTKADSWSLGVILYAMLAGNLPFGKDLLRCQRFAGFSSKSDLSWFFPRHISSQVIDLIVKLLDPNPITRMSVHEAQNHPWVLDISPPFIDEEEEEGVVLTGGVGGVASLQEEDDEEDDDEEEEIFHDHDEDDDEDDEEDEEEEEESYASFTRGRPIFRSPPVVQPNMELESLCKSPGTGGTSFLERRLHRSLSPTNNSSSEPKLFNDVVKRSTRFSTSVPAIQVLSQIKQIVQEYPLPNQKRIGIDHDLYHLDVSTKEDIKLVTVHVYLIKSGTYMVEFLRENLDIFQFKQWYEQIRQRLSKIVKHDYNLAILDEIQ